MKTRLLLVHNFYQSSSPSGENQSVASLAETLERQADIEVLLYGPSSDQLRGGIREAATTSAGMVGVRRAELSKLIADWRPQVVQLHNPYPLVGLGGFASAQRAGLKTVHVVHNYRHSCSAGSHRLRGEDCFACERSGALPSVINACYRGSRPQSLVLAAAERRFATTWRSFDAYVAVSRYLAGQLPKDWVPRERIHVVYNPVQAPAGDTRVGRDVVFAGRLAEEKGIRLLIDAWRRTAPATQSGRRLIFVGDGPLSELVQTFCAEPRNNAKYLGLRSRVDTMALMAGAGVVVVPSIWQEPLGRVVLEAFAAGRPVIASAVGGMTELVDASVGWSVAPTVTALVQALEASSRADLSALGAAAQARWSHLAEPEAVARRYVRLYECLLSRQ